MTEPFNDIYSLQSDIDSEPSITFSPSLLVFPTPGCPLFLGLHRNSSGARTVPCGTPDVTSVASLCSPLTNTCCHLPVRKSFNQARVSPWIP